MKRLFSILAIACIMAFGTVNASTNANTTTTIVNTVVSAQEDGAAAEEDLGLSLIHISEPTRLC